MQLAGEGITEPGGARDSFVAPGERRCVVPVLFRQTTGRGRRGEQSHSAPRIPFDVLGGGQHHRVLLQQEVVEVAVSYGACPAGAGNVACNREGSGE
jgi:hypothetical protein